jgi:anti-sigma B factor antagonist
MQTTSPHDVMPDSFEVSSHELGKRRRSVEVTGVIDLFTASDLKGSLLEAIERDCELLVDLTGATYLDSSGLGVLLSAAKRADQLGGQMIIAGAGPDIARVFQITGLDTLFTIVPTRADGLATFDGSARPAS